MRDTALGRVAKVGQTRNFSTTSNCCTHSLRTYSVNLPTSSVTKSQLRPLSNTLHAQHTRGKEVFRHTCRHSPLSNSAGIAQSGSLCAPLSYKQLGLLFCPLYPVMFGQIVLEILSPRSPGVLLLAGWPAWTQGPYSLHRAITACGVTRTRHCIVSGKGGYSALLLSEKFGRKQATRRESVRVFLGAAPWASGDISSREATTRRRGRSPISPSSARHAWGTTRTCG